MTQEGLDLFAQEEGVTPAPWGHGSEGKDGRILREAEESQSWSSWPACTLLAQTHSFLISLALHCFVCVDHKLNFAPAESNPFGFWLHKPGMSVLGALGLQAEADINQMKSLL